MIIRSVPSVIGAASSTAPAVICSRPADRVITLANPGAQHVYLGLVPIGTALTGLAANKATWRLAAGAYGLEILVAADQDLWHVTNASTSTLNAAELDLTSFN